MTPDTSEMNALTHLDSLGNIEPVLKYAGMNAENRLAYATQLATDSGDCGPSDMTSALEGMLGSMPMREVTVQATISIKLVVPHIMDIGEMVEQFVVEADYNFTSRTGGVLITGTNWIEHEVTSADDDVSGEYFGYVQE